MLSLILGYFNICVLDSVLPVCSLILFLIHFLFWVLFLSILRTLLFFKLLSITELYSFPFDPLITISKQFNLFIHMYYSFYLSVCLYIYLPTYLPPDLSICKYFLFWLPISMVKTSQQWQIFKVSTSNPFTNKEYYKHFSYHELWVALDTAQLLNRL